MFFKPDSLKDYLIHLSIILVLSVGIVIYLFNKYLPEYTRFGQQIEVPILQGKTLNQAQEILKDSDLRYTLYDSAYVQGESPGKILSQHPRAGETVKLNRKIYLTITSEKPVNVVMPDLINKTLKNANLLLEQAGLNLGETAYISDEFPLILKQKIEGTEIKPGQMVPKYSKIDLIIGDGQKTDQDKNTEEDVENL